MPSVLHRLLGDNVFLATLGTVLIPALAVVFVGLNLLIRDGPNVAGELQFLEFVGGGGTVASGIYGVVHAWLNKPGGAPTSQGGATNVPTQPGA